VSVNLSGWVNLSLIPPGLHEQAEQALKDYAVIGFLSKADNMKSLEIVWQNWNLLQSMGLYEEALLHAFTAARLNNHHVPSARQSFLFRIADRAKLRAAGDPFPSAGPFTLYRGVAGIGRGRRIRGYSWTASLHKAQWFAARGFSCGGTHPSVYSVTVRKSAVLAYSNDREEEEFIVALPSAVKLLRIKESFLELFPEFITPNKKGA